MHRRYQYVLWFVLLFVLPACATVSSGLDAAPTSPIESQQIPYERGTDDQIDKRIAELETAVPELQGVSHQSHYRVRTLDAAPAGVTQQRVHAFYTQYIWTTYGERIRANTFTFTVGKAHKRDVYRDATGQPFLVVATLPINEAEVIAIYATTDTP